MAPIAVLPVFFKLAGKRAVLAGGTLPAVWKTELLAAAGARIEVFAADPCLELRDLIMQADTVTLHRRAWEPADLEGAAIAIGAIEEEDEAAAFRDAAHKAGVPVNVIDRPAFCDFQFGTIVSRSPLLIGISTDGAAPVLGQVIRARIEALLPQSLSRWAKAAEVWRPALQASRPGFRARRAFWEAFARLAFEHGERAPEEADRRTCMDAADRMRSEDLPARLTLVCAGTGHPDAMTLGAIGALQAADTIVHGASVSAGVLDLARREALKVLLSDEKADMPACLTDALTPGRHVVWLDEGNPDLCRRWAERRRALAALKIVIDAKAGLGVCSACTPACPAWAAR